MRERSRRLYLRSLARALGARVGAPPEYRLLMALQHTSQAPAPAHACPRKASPRPEVAKRLDEALRFADAAHVVRLIHFNDVYNVEGFKKEPVGGAARFRTALQAQGEAIIVFSGDAFAPSVMSTMLRGAQMPPVLQALNIDVAMLGNHDFDFGVERAIELTGQTTFPWLLSNAKMKATAEQMGQALETVTLERKGHKFGFFGLIEFEWLSTLNSISVEDVEYEDFVVCAKRLSATLREECGCEIVIALTHMRQPNDTRLAKEAADCVDLILGGHDHHYEVFEENGVLVCKSGTDFKDATVVDLSFHDDHRKPTVSSHYRVVVDSTIAEDDHVKSIVDSFAKQCETSLDEPVGMTLGVDIDARFIAIRTAETNCGNLVADVIRNCAASDIALLNSGTLRSDAVHSAGAFTKRDLVQLLPMADELCVLKIDGLKLKLALENSVSQWPRLEGRFAQVSGLRFEFDASKPPHERVRKVTVADEPLDPNRMYTIAIKQYMRSGKDGYEMLPECPVHVDSEHLPALQHMLVDYFRSAKAPITPLRDGRITLVGADPVIEPLVEQPADVTNQAIAATT